MSGEKITRYHVINKENMLFGWEKKEDSSVIFFLFKDKAYIYMYYYCLIRK